MLALNLTEPTSSSDKEVLKYDLSYGIIIDAGSTGSRLFLYSWTSKSDQELIDIKAVVDQFDQPVVKKVSPGLSTFSNNPKAAPDYFRPLLDYAGKFIPEEKHSVTPLFIFATAGMRLLTIEQQNNIMEILHSTLPTLTKFQVLSSHIQIISGKWEGIYSWIGVNYILGHFKFEKESVLKDPHVLDEHGIWKERASSNLKTPLINRPKTAGMIDMGGASAQIAFELPEDSQFTNENVQMVNLGPHEKDHRFLYKLFVTTFLGFGVNEGAKKYEHFLSNQLSEDPVLEKQPTLKITQDNSISYVRDGCLPTNYIKLVSNEDGDQFVRKGTGEWDSCVNNLVNLIFHGPDSISCPVEKRCFFGGVEAPGASFDLSNIELYGFSEYWFSVEDILNLGGIYDHDVFEKNAKEFCSQRWKSIKRKAQTKLYPKADEERLETQCFKSAWIHAILHNGFGVNETGHHFRSAFKINGAEVQWALGAMIYNMRFFPLLNAQKQDLALKHLHFDKWNRAPGTVFYLLIIIFILFVLLFYSTILPKKFEKYYSRYIRKKINQII